MKLPALLILAVALALPASARPVAKDIRPTQYVWRGFWDITAESYWVIDKQWDMCCPWSAYTYELKPISWAEYQTLTVPSFEEYAAGLEAEE